MVDVKYLTKTDIENVDDITIEDVPVPEWGGVVRVKGLSGTERDEYEVAILKQREDGTWASTEESLKNARAELIVRALVDKDGKQMFTMKDAEKLGKKSAVALQRVWDKARELAGLTEKDVEDLVKNSKADQSESSTSDSH